MTLFQAWLLYLAVTTVLVTALCYGEEWLHRYRCRRARKFYERDAQEQASKLPDPGIYSGRVMWK